MAAKKNTNKEKGKEMLKHVGVGVLGSLGGGYLGKFGVIAGIASIGYGVWKDEDLALTAGGAMFTGAAFQHNPNAKMADAGKANAKAVVKGMAAGLFLDKVKPIKEKLDQMGGGFDHTQQSADPYIMSQLQEQAKAMNGLAQDSIPMGGMKGLDRIAI